MRDQHGDGGAAALTTSAAQSGNNASSQDSDPNLKTLQDFQKTVQEEHKSGEKRIEEINANLEAVKKQIDEERSQLDDLRAKLKQVNEEKDADYPKFVELRNSLAEAKNQMKTFDDKVGGIVAAKSRKERLDIQNLSRSLEQIEKDIQTKKLSKEEERKLVSRSREIATKLHTLKLMHKKEDHFRNISSKYDGLKDKVRDIFRRKEEFGNRIGKLKESLSTLVNQRENLYEERRNVIHSVREATAKLEMIDTQLKAIQYKRTRMQAAEYRQRRQKESDERRVARQEAIQERAKRDKEYQDRWNTLKEAAMKKMSSGEKLTFDEMKLIFSDSDSD